MKKIARIMIAAMFILFAVTACNYKYIPVYMPHQITYVVDGSVFDTKSSVLFEEPSSAPEKIGYTFIGWAYADGSMAEEGDFLGSDVIVYAVWQINAGTVELPSGGSIEDAIASGADILYLDSGNYTVSNQIDVSDSLSIIGSGDNETSIIGAFMLERDASIQLVDLTLSAANSGQHIIESIAGGAEIVIEDSVLNTAENGRGIYIHTSTDEDRALPIDISIRNSRINLNPVSGTAGSCGIYIRGGENLAGDRISHISLAIEDSEIINDTPTGSSYEAALYSCDSIDFRISNSTLSSESNHYPVLVYDCGSYDTDSTIRVENNSELAGYGPIYIRNCTNVHAIVNDSRLVGVNNNPDKNPDGSAAVNDFSVLNIQDSQGCSIVCDNCDFTVGKLEGKGAMNVFCFQHNPKALGAGDLHDGGNTFRITNSRFESYSSHEDGWDFGSIDIWPGAEPNTFYIDSYSEENLTSLVEGSRIDVVHETYTVDGTEINWDIYILTTD